MHLLANPRYLRRPLRRLHWLDPEGALWALELLNVVELPALEGWWWVNKKLLASTPVRFVSLSFFTTTSRVKVHVPISCGVRWRCHRGLLDSTRTRPLGIGFACSLMDSSSRRQRGTLERIRRCCGAGTIRLVVSPCFPSRYVALRQPSNSPADIFATSTVPELYSPSCRAWLGHTEYGERHSDCKRANCEVPVAQERCIRNRLSNKTSVGGEVEKRSFSNIRFFGPSHRRSEATTGWGS